MPSDFITKDALEASISKPEQISNSLLHALMMAKLAFSNRGIPPHKIIHERIY
jgi:hypothetical protein